LLDQAAGQLNLEQLAMPAQVYDAFSRALQKPHGIILVTGPTGSGKTVSLYTGLNILNTPERNISTAEDPIEINMDGINQT